MREARPGATGALARWLGAAVRERGLERRVMLYVGLGCLAGLLFFAYLAHGALRESTGIIYAERLQLARLAAHEVAQALVGRADALEGGDVPEQVTELLHAYSMGPVEGERRFHLSLIDREGTLLAESHPIPGASDAEHAELLRPFLEGSRPGLVIHVPANAPEKTHLLAYAPLPGLPGGVTLEQLSDAALAVPRSLQRRMAISGVLFSAAGLIAAGFAARQVARPLTTLTAVTRAIAAGDLSTPVPQGGWDEVRDLAASSEAMRRQLQQTHAELARTNQDLERRVRERTRELELRHAELDRATALLRRREAERGVLLRRTIQAQEDERRRVARELHDSVGQFLSMVVVRLSLLERQVDAGAPAATAAIGELSSLTSRAVDEVRRLAVALRPEMLDEMGLPAAVGYHAEQVLERHGIAVTLDAESLSRRLPPEVELVAFRVVQEALTNVLKHARAKNVAISLECRGGELRGVVADDGVGFEAPAQPPGPRGPGVGLIGMRERVELLGGTLDVDTAPRRGTRLRFRVPVPRDAPVAQGGSS